MKFFFLIIQMCSTHREKNSMHVSYFKLLPNLVQVRKGVRFYFENPHDADWMNLEQNITTYI